MSLSISNLDDVKRVLEAVLLSSSEPLTQAELKRVFDGEMHSDFLRIALEELRGDWQAMTCCWKNARNA